MWDHFFQVNRLSNKLALLLVLLLLAARSSRWYQDHHTFLALIFCFAPGAFLVVYLEYHYLRLVIVIRTHNVPKKTYILLFLPTILGRDYYVKPPEVVGAHIIGWGSKVRRESSTHRRNQVLNSRDKFARHVPSWRGVEAYRGHPGSKLRVLGGSGTRRAKIIY